MDRVALYVRMLTRQGASSEAVSASLRACTHVSQRFLELAANQSNPPVRNGIRAENA
jgi:hypothetical protein